MAVTIRVMGTALTDFGGTFKGTASLTQEDGTKTEFFIEENIDPVIVMQEPGKRTLAFTVINIDTAVLERLLGGSTDVTSGDWSAPRDIVKMERSLELVTDYNIRVQIPRADVVAKLNWNFSRTEVAKIEVTAAILTPTKAGVAPLIIGDAP